MSCWPLRCCGMTRVNEGSHSFTCHPHVYSQVEWTIPAFTPQLQSVTTLWLVLISCPTEDRRLSWPVRLGEILRWFAHPKTVTHPLLVAVAGIELTCVWLVWFLLVFKSTGVKEITQDLIMVALWNRADHYIFILWFPLLSSSSFFFFLFFLA